MRVRVVLAASMLICGLTCVAVNGQSTPIAAAAPAYVPTMTFDVASVHQSPDAPSYTLMATDDPRNSLLRIENFDIRNILTHAYGFDYYQIVGMPNWPPLTMFTIVAKSNAEMDKKLASLSKEDAELEKRHALQVLLADRFKLKVHWETRLGDIYNLVAAKGGPKLLPAGSLPPTEAEKKWMGIDSDGQPKVFPIHQQCEWPVCKFFGHSCTIDQLTGYLSPNFGRPVADKTELTGKYDFVVSYHGATDNDRKADDTDPTLPLDSALRVQMGLQLEAAKGPIRVLVIDHIEKPTEN